MEKGRQEKWKEAETEENKLGRKKKGGWLKGN